MHLIIALLMRFGVLITPVEILHKQFLHGRITHESFFKRLKPRQYERFIEFHRNAKVELQKSFDMGMADTVMSEKITELFNEFPLAKMMMEGEGVLLTPSDRRRVYFALNQLDNLIENGTLEKRVLGKKAGNIVGQSN
jgi:hypothetical protein